MGGMPGRDMLDPSFEVSLFDLCFRMHLHDEGAVDWQRRLIGWHLRIVLPGLLDSSLHYKGESGSNTERKRFKLSFILVRIVKLWREWET